CWASLWNERAVAYRDTHDVDPAGVRLAVVVQRMVDARAAGVLFTADPITGRRRRAAIDAVAGLGERLVSGAVNPDHFLVDPRTVAQGAFDPFTPMGLQTFRLLGAAFASAIGRPVRDPAAGTPVTVVAGMRLFLDLTAVLRDPAARELPGRVMGVMEARSQA